MMTLISDVDGLAVPLEFGANKVRCSALGSEISGLQAAPFGPFGRSAQAGQIQQASPFAGSRTYSNKGLHDLSNHGEHDKEISTNEFRYGTQSMVRSA
jgi:hypothetical protein